MVPLRVLTLAVSNPMQPAVLVLEPIEEDLGGATRIMPIWVGPSEAASLGLAIENQRAKRPLTHDLFLDALTNLDARIDHVLIDKAEAQVFYSKLVLKQGDRLIELDARPTDAITLAIRQGAPLFVEEETLANSSYPYIFKREAAGAATLEEFRSFLDDISPEDFA
ncbi:MAG: bifunctional nuclease family protein [Eggerthellaceae bacterium]|nr:bifunctional nuclease family protein [Eggerthellaceae bacterium]